MDNNKVKKIDAKDKVLGRLASEVVWYLMGKDDPSFERHNINASSEVYVFNTDLIKFTGNKLTQKMYYKHSGYPGGLKATPLEKLMEKDSTIVLEKAVFGMLPKNKLRPDLLKRLKLYSGEIK